MMCAYKYREKFVLLTPREEIFWSFFDPLFFSLFFLSFGLVFSHLFSHKTQQHRDNEKEV